MFTANTQAKTQVSRSSLAHTVKGPKVTSAGEQTEKSSLDHTVNGPKVTSAYY